MEARAYTWSRGRTSRKQFSNRDRSLSSLPIRPFVRHLPLSRLWGTADGRTAVIYALVLLFLEILDSLVLLFERGMCGEDMCGVQL